MTARMVYHRPTDMFATFVSATSKGYVDIDHPYLGRVRVPANTLTEVSA